MVSNSLENINKLMTSLESD